MNIIEAHNLTYQYPDGTQALNDINFYAEEGGITVILGSNGAGKSTLLLHLNATLKPKYGVVYLKGKPFAYDKKSLQSIRSTVGFVFQNPDDQLIAPTVYHDVAFGPRNMKLQDIDTIVDEALSLVGMQNYADKPPHFLSHGQKKRVAIAGVIAMNPEVLVLDEPTSGLDPKGCDDVMEILNELNAEGKTIIFSTHDVDLAAKWADRIYVLHEGRVEQYGTPSEIFSEHAMISNTGLKLPTFVQTFRELKLRGISGGDSPLTMLNFVDSVSKPFNVLRVRCAIAGNNAKKGEKVGIIMNNGMLYTVDANNPKATAFGRVMHNANIGEEIVVEVSESLTHKIGRIYIVSVPKTERDSKAVSIHEVIDRYQPHKIGVMGRYAKIMLRKLNISCDFQVDVAQTSILAAHRGFDVMVFASSKMAEQVIQKIEERNEKIQYSRINI